MKRVIHKQLQFYLVICCQTIGFHITHQMKIWRTNITCENKINELLSKIKLNISIVSLKIRNQEHKMIEYFYHCNTIRKEGIQNLRSGDSQSFKLYYSYDSTSVYTVEPRKMVHLSPNYKATQARSDLDTGRGHCFFQMQCL